MNVQLGLQNSEDMSSSDHDLMHSQGRTLHPHVPRSSLVSSMTSVLDGGDYHRSEHHLATSLHPGIGFGGDSPPASANSYTTLTPLQPLHDKFHHHQHHQCVPVGNVIGSFTLMREDRGLGPPSNFYSHYPKDISMGQSLSSLPSPNLTTMHSYGHPSGHLANEKMVSGNGFEAHHSMFSRIDQHFSRELSPPPSSGVGKLKSGRETFKRMWRWLQEPEFQRMAALRLEACKRKEQEQSKAERNHVPKRHRLVFTDIQRRTLHAIFLENQRPSKELQITIAQQLGLELSTVSNFFMNARRRSLDKWMDEGHGRPPSSGSLVSKTGSAIACTKA
ncbi:hypothetical protein XELAEV_18040362mg [Xenopus laevis]|uniref:Homeobox domain-containing protein n=1 Tax=Xenopus laevis TaxID=8355 RepID=A0A974C9E6_XENLA|nr:hypothetical protein XELAEV_18040362mg [Xenopus laevis]